MTDNHLYSLTHLNERLITNDPHKERHPEDRIIADLHKRERIRATQFAHGVIPEWSQKLNVRLDKLFAAIETLKDVLVAKLTKDPDSKSGKKTPKK